MSDKTDRLPATTIGSSENNRLRDALTAVLARAIKAKWDEEGIAEDVARIARNALGMPAAPDGEI